MADIRDRDPKQVVRDSDNRIARAYRGDAVCRDRGYFRWLAVLTPSCSRVTQSSLSAVAVAFRSPRSWPARFA
jgi:hypothetical protein